VPRRHREQYLLAAAPALASEARRLGTTLLRATGAAALLPLLLTLFGAGAALTNPGTSAVLAALTAGALTGAWWYLSSGRNGRAFVATCCATMLPVPIVGAGHYPYVLVSSPGVGMTIDEAVTDGATLKILTVFGVVLIPVILAYQAWSWWAFRGRTGRRHPRYF
jgi:cytochrome d ubiquinol oxidase subunit II